MSPRTLQYLILCALLGLLALAVLRPDAMLSPGALRPAHQALASDCFACHTPWRGPGGDRCATCHRIEDIGLVTTRGAKIERDKPVVGFHQQLAERDCMACHIEHQARNAALAKRPFSHALLEPSVRGMCLTCHTKPADALHAQVTEGCQQCHSQERWRPASFEHSRYFLLSGEHDAPCATCHAGGSFSKYTCYGCHEHSPERVRAEHAEEGVSASGNCVECHRRGEDEGDAGEDD